MNSKKKILILSPFFYPEPISTGKFNTDVAVSLSKKGNHVTVLCFHPFYPDWKIKKSNKKLDKINIIRGGKYLKFSNKTIIRRLVLELSFAFFVLRKLKKQQKNTDLIIPVFPPSLSFYMILPFLRKNIKKVGMVHDLQEVYSSNKKGVFNKMVKFFIHKVEKKCFNECDRIVFLSNEMKNTASDIYKLENDKSVIQYPFHTITNSVTNKLENTLKKENINIVYSGALGEKQNPFELLKFFDYVSKKTEKMVFHFFSQGTFFNELKKHNQNPKIKFHGLVPRENLEELYKRSDLQIIPQLENTSKGSLPSKLPNLLASGCKTLIITDKNSEIENLFLEFKLQKVVTSWDFDLMLKSMNQALNNNIDLEHQKTVAKELFTIDKMIAKILT